MQAGERLPSTALPPPSHHHHHHLWALYALHQCRSPRKSNSHLLRSTKNPQCLAIGKPHKRQFFTREAWGAQLARRGWNPRILLWFIKIGGVIIRLEGGNEGGRSWLKKNKKRGGKREKFRRIQHCCRENRLTPSAFAMALQRLLSI